MVIVLVLDSCCCFVWLAVHCSVVGAKSWAFRPSQTVLGTVITCRQIGSYNTIKPKCNIGKGVTINDDCMIATMVRT